MDRAREADVLWERGAELYQTAPWAFTPAETVRRSLTELARTLSAHGISQRHLTDVAAWRLIAESLVAERDSAVSRVIHNGHGHAGRLIEELARPSKGPGRFPLLSGPKVGPMWVRMQAYPGSATISDLASIPVAVDVQVRTVAEYLGLTDTVRQPEIDRVRGVIREAWQEQVRLRPPLGRHR
jgi:hypothetical protein